MKYMKYTYSTSRLSRARCVSRSIYVYVFFYQDEHVHRTQAPAVLLNLVTAEYFREVYTCGIQNKEVWLLKTR